MGDNLKKFENGRQPQNSWKGKMKMEKWKWKNENGRRPEKSLKCKMRFFFLNEDDLKSKQ